jgi:CHAT domain-containing protein/tetratricopeptide (TPR) repeat protein
MPIWLVILMCPKLALAQSDVLNEARTMFNSGEMVQSAALLDQAYQYYIKRDYIDSAAFALAHQSTPVAYMVDINSGLQLIDQSLRLFQTINKPSPNIEMSIYGDAIKIYSMMGEMDTTSYFLNKTSEIIEAYPDVVDQKQVAWFYWNMSTARYDGDNLSSSLQYAIKAKELFLEIYGIQSNQHAAVLGWLATLNDDLGHYEDAIDYIKKSIEIHESKNIPSYNLCIANNQLAGYYNGINDWKNALFYNDRALEIGEQLILKGEIDESYLTACHTTRAISYTGLHKFREALIEEKKCELAMEDNQEFYSPYHIYNLHQGYLDLDSLEMARIYLEKTWSYYRARGSGNRNDYSQILRIDGAFDFKLGRFDSSLMKLKEAVRIRDSIMLEPEYYMTTTYEQLGLTYCALDSFSHAIIAFEKADSIGRLLFNQGHQSILSFNKNKAECLCKQGRLDEAELVLLDLIEEIGIDTKSFKTADWTGVTMQPGVLDLLSSHVLLLLDKYKRKPSLIRKDRLIVVVENYMEYMERYIGFFDSFSSHMNIGNEYFETLARVIDVVFEENQSAVYDEFVFNCIQKSKSLISRLVLNDVSLDQFGGVPDSIIAHELQLRSKLNMTATQLLDKSYTPVSNDDPFLSLEREHRTLQEHIREHYPDYFKLKYDFTVPSLKDMKRSAKRGSIFLEYFISDSFAMVVSITSSECKIHRLMTNTSILSDKINNLNQKIADVTSNDWRPVAIELYEDLVKPLDIDFTPYDHILICPDGLMFELAMELCVSPDKIEPRPILYVIEARDAIANPDNQLSDKRSVLVFAPSFTHIKRTAVLPQPFSRSLAEKIESNFEADIYFDQDANESTFKSQTGNYPILHISTHGILDENDPLSSYLLFYDDSLNDGRLTLKELYGMRLHSNLTLLNACSTSKGKFRKGAGMASLASGFQYAGCQNLITSLWSVDEKANSKILEHLYVQLKESVSPAQALFEAKKTFLLEAPPELKHPYYWAGISLIGRQEDLDSTGFTGFYKIILVALGLIFILVFLSSLFKRRV